jgi:PAS domain S-box-containing protein
MSTEPSPEELERKVRVLETEVAKWRDTAESLQQEHDFLDALLSTADCLVIVLDPDGNIVRFNKACEMLSGYTFEEVEGAPFWNRLLAAEEVESVKAVFSELSAGQFPNRNENYWLTKNGSRRLISWSNTALLDDSGSVAHVIGTGIDITERRRAEEELSESHRNLERRVEERTAQLDQANAELKVEISERECVQERLMENEERFRAFLDNSPALAYMKDASGRHLYANKTLCDTWEITPDSFIGTNVHDFLPRDAAKRIEAWDEEIIRRGVPLETSEYSDKLLDQVRWWKEIKFPVRLPSGERLIGGIVFNITERKKTEEAMEEQLLFERLIANIAKQLTETKPGQLQQTIDATLQSLGTTLNIERAFLAQFSGDGKILRHTNIWGAEGIDVPPDLFVLDLNAETPWVAQQIRKGLAINTGPGLAGLPDDAKGARLWLQERGINSGVVVPVWAEGGGIGMLGLDTMQEPREYPQEIVDRLRIVADMIGSTLQRVRVQERLQNSLGEIKELRDRLEEENILLREEIDLQHKHEEIVGKSKPVMEMLSRAEQVAKTDSTVLLFGETGAGKESLARTIHRLSRRKDRPLITVNCAALPSTLVEAELFGREKGAYTGAMTRQIGRFEVANGSTLFLDEIGELPLEAQATLLRVLDEGEFERLGSPKKVRVDVRLIASTNRDLEEEVSEGRFREDLYYRLNVFSITVPPLRDRKEDIPLLVWAFAREYERSMGKPVEKIRKDTMARLSHYGWPGNVRELRNVIERAMILTRGSTLRIDVPATSRPPQDRSNRTLEDVERRHILQVLENVGWRVSGSWGAAEILGLKPTTLEARMKKLGIKRPARGPSAPPNGV